MLMISLGMRYHSGESVFGNLTARRRSDSPGKTAKSSLFFRGRDCRQPRISAENGTSTADNFWKNSKKQREAQCLAKRPPVSAALMHRELMLQHQTGAARGLHRTQHQPGRTFLMGADLAGDVLRVPRRAVDLLVAQS